MDAYNPRKLLKMMVNDFVYKDKKNSVQKLFDNINDIPNSEVDGCKISRDQYYRYIRKGSNSVIKKGSLEFIYKYFEKNHPDIYNKYVGIAFKKSISEIGSYKGDGDCAICCQPSKYLLNLSNINNKSKIAVSATKSDDFPVEIYLCHRCFVNKKDLLNAPYGELIARIIKYIDMSEVATHLGVSESTINKIKNKKVNIIDKAVCEKIYSLFRFVEEKDRPMQLAIDFFLGKITATEISESLAIFNDIEEFVEDFIAKEIEEKLSLEDCPSARGFYKVNHQIGQPSLLEVVMDCSVEGMPLATFSLELNASWDYLHNITHDSGRSDHSFLFEIKVEDRMDLGGVTKKAVDGKPY